MSVMPQGPMTTLERMKDIIAGLPPPMPPIFVSTMLPYWGTQPGKMKLSPRVVCTDAFRKEMDAWLADFFGNAISPQPVLIQALRTPDGVFVSPQLYAQLKQDGGYPPWLMH